MGWLSPGGFWELFVFSDQPFFYRWTDHSGRDPIHLSNCLVASLVWFPFLTSIHLLIGFVYCPQPQKKSINFIVASTSNSKKCPSFMTPIFPKGCFFLEKKSSWGTLEQYGFSDLGYSSSWRLLVRSGFHAFSLSGCWGGKGVSLPDHGGKLWFLIGKAYESE